MPLLSCSGQRPPNLGLREGALAPCPATPNCVASNATDSHRVEPFTLAQPAERAWAAVRAAVSAMPRTTIVEHDDSYLHAECASAVFGFVDDLELHLRAADGVNRRRVERLRKALQADHAIR